jgi:hypothetical protein
MRRIQKEASMETNHVSNILAGETKNGSVPVAEPQAWKPRFWDNERHAALRFVSEEELDKAIDWLWSAPELRRLPRVHVGQNTMIVPAQTADLFAKQGFQFSVGNVISAGDLSAEKANHIRSGK